MSLFGRKKVDYRVEHRYPVSDPQFAREMSALLGPSILPGNRVEALNNGHEIFPSMLDAIGNAESTITLETFIYWSGDIGRRFADALSRRAEAGVEVSLLLDWVGCDKMDPALLQSMEASGVRIVQHRPLSWYNVGRLNNRTHRKLMVVDGKTGFTGGVGIADVWQGDAQDPEHWRDIHFKVSGPVVAQMQSAFNDNWTKNTGVVLNGADYFPELERAGEAPAQMFVASPEGGSESMHLMYLLAIAAAVETVDLQAAYFVPDSLAIKEILLARKRGARVRVIVPGQYIDEKIVRVASKAHWGRLLAAGVEIHEYQPSMFHNKMLIVDGEMTSVGSTNFDMRSFCLNDEANLNIYDRDFAKAMTDRFEQDLKPTRRYTLEDWAGRSLKERWLETVVLPLKSQL